VEDLGGGVDARGVGDDSKQALGDLGREVELAALSPAATARSQQKALVGEASSPVSGQGTPQLIAQATNHATLPAHAVSMLSKAGRAMPCLWRIRLTASRQIQTVSMPPRCIVTAAHPVTVRARIADGGRHASRR
jgi:hypothetical protein